MHELSFGDPRIGAEIEGRGFSRWSQAGGVLQRGKQEDMVHMHEHSSTLVTPFATDLDKAGILICQARAGAPESSSNVMQRTKSCLSWVWSCLGAVLFSRHSIRRGMFLYREIQCAQWPTQRGHQLPISISPSQFQPIDQAP